MPVAEIDKLISDQALADFKEIGAVHLRQAFDPSWVQSLQNAIEQEINGKASKLRDEFTLSGSNGRFVSELFVWWRNESFKNFVYNSPAAAIAARFFGSQRVNLLFDQVLVKEPGTNDRTNWHQDQPYWPVSGQQILTIWLALDTVSEDSGSVQFIPGSHLSGERYRPEHPDAVPGSGYENIDLPRCPDFHKEDRKSNAITWNLEPGDCYVFDSRTIHGAAGNSSTTLRRRGYATRWTGDDVRFVTGKHVLPMPSTPDLENGAVLDCDLFPCLWSKEEARAAG